jgi:DNA end-binding protein Ku
MARPVWNGTISFALLSVPVKLYTATRPKDISFNQIEKATGGRIKQKKVSASTGEEVSADEIAKGYEIRKDEYVIIEPDELEALAPRDSANDRVIQILDFVDAADIDPVHYEKAYYVAPDKGGARPYALLVKAMAAAQKVAIAKVVLRQKEYLTALRPSGDMLCMETMYFADEVVDPAEIDELSGAAPELNERELEMARMLVETSSTEFEPAKYRDEYRDKVMALIDSKAAGTVFEAPKALEAPKVVDLMAALEASLAAAKAAQAKKTA